jgi:hypothetical protein
MQSKELLVDGQGLDLSKKSMGDSHTNFVHRDVVLTRASPINIILPQNLPSRASQHKIPHPKGTDSEYLDYVVDDPNDA